MDPHIQHEERLNIQGSFAPFVGERLQLISLCLADVVVAMGFEKVCCSKNLQIFLYSKVQLNRVVPEVFKIL